jgi:hypothetical protein
VLEAISYSVVVWSEMERHLYGAPDAQSAPEDDGSDDSDSGDDGDDFYEEDSEVAIGDKVY